MRYIRSSLLLSGVVAVSVLCRSCSMCGRPRQEEISVDSAEFAGNSGYLDVARKVFYALPTPVEVSLLIKNSGVGFRPELLNDPANASGYLTNTRMALNFGIYITDITYAGLFEQAQTVLRYKQAILQLTEGLGIGSALDAGIMERLEAEIDDRDEMLRIIADAYASCTAYLDEEDRHFLTLVALVGGWVEGMYIATDMIDEKIASAETGMRQLVIDQKLTFDLMREALNAMNDNPEIAELKDKMSGLEQVFARVVVRVTPATVTSGESGGIDRISSETSDNITPELYAEIKEQIRALRRQFIQK